VKEVEVTAVAAVELGATGNVTAVIVEELADVPEVFTDLTR
jgi:hypothetical protein